MILLVALADQRIFRFPFIALISTVVGWFFVIDLITDHDAPTAPRSGRTEGAPVAQPRCLGALAYINGAINIIWSKRTILASGATT